MQIFALQFHVYIYKTSICICCFEYDISSIVPKGCVGWTETLNETFHLNEQILNIYFTYKNVKCQVRRSTRGGGLPCPFLKIKKSALILEKKCPDCVHPQVKFAIQNVVLRVSKRKNSKIFSCVAFFLDFLIKCLSKCPNFTKPPLR